MVREGGEGFGNSFLISLDFLWIKDVPTGISDPCTLLILGLCGLIQLATAFSDTFLHFSIIFCFSCSFGHCIVWTYLIKKIQKFIYPAPPDVLLPLAPPPPPLLRLPPPDHLFLPHLDFEELWVDLIPVSSPELKITKRKVNYKYQTIVKIIG